MRDADIRGALHDRLTVEFAGDRIRDEMGLCLGATRVDIAVINGCLHGYEIKSDRDTLARLPNQIELYDSVLDYSTIVCGPRYADRIKAVVPTWWGITIAEDHNGRPEFYVSRKARRNTHVDRFALAQLLWRDEAAALLTALGHRVTRRHTRWQLWDQLAELPLGQLQHIVRTQLKARPLT
ncbi:sce7726 family protein [Nocardia abscessus]|uniref:sce7726 family protein n=1 Tax=Nocardia abscessus TaxID=120957 RepID=UPI002458CA24|nr:sce7726 family protein [Nocardia abscessus]